MEPEFLGNCIQMSEDEALVAVTFMEEDDDRYALRRLLKVKQKAREDVRTAQKWTEGGLKKLRPDLWRYSARYAARPALLDALVTASYAEQADIKGLIKDMTVEQVRSIGQNACRDFANELDACQLQFGQELESLPTAA